MGRHLFRKLGNDHSIATFNSTPFGDGIFFDSVTMHLSDVIDYPETISSAVILLGDTSPDRCFDDVSRSFDVNVKSIISILDQLREWGVKPVFTSSEAVFDGQKGDYTETDIAEPILVYGRQKLQVEKYIEDYCQNGSVLRLAKVFGTTPNDGTMFTQWAEELKNGVSIRCAYDQIFSPVHVDDVAEGIIRIINSDERGLFHVASLYPYSRIDLLNMLIDEVKGYHPINSDVIPMSINDFPVRERRPSNLSMVPEKFITATGLKMTDMESVCRSVVTNVF